MVIKHPRKKGPHRTCVYCESQRELTRDHVPPKNLFAKPLPPGLVTVPCCRKCNTSASKDDEYFRFIILREDAGDHPEARKVFPIIVKSLQRSQAMGFTNLLRRNIFDIDVYLPDGSYIERRGGYRVNVPRLNRVASRIVKGLFWKEFGARLPDNYKPKSWKDSDLAFTKKELMAQEPHKIIGNNVFEYWVQTVPGDKYTTAWVLRFYEAVSFSCITAPTDALNRRRNVAS